MKEIGGYFELDELVKNEYYNNLICVNNGRSALLYILKAKNIKKIHIPYYLCDSISNMLSLNYFEFDYYNIDKNFNPIFNKELNKDEYLYIVNYYGQLENEHIIELKNKFKYIILDNTHAFFQKPIEGIDIIYSCRKFFGVPDGAYISTDTAIKEELEVDISKDRMTHILGRYEGNASEYYNRFHNNDLSFRNESLKKVSRLTKNLLGAIDYNRIYNIRTKNYDYLNKHLEKYNKLKLKKIEGSFCYPIYLENGDKIKKALVNKKIYIATLWPNVLNETLESSIEYKFAKNILPLPCDQRYNKDDMDILIKEVLRCIN